MESKNYVEYKVSIWYRANFADDANMEAIKDMIDSQEFDEILNDESFENEEMLEEYPTLQSAIVDVKIFKNNKLMY